MAPMKRLLTGLLLSALLLALCGMVHPSAAFAASDEPSSKKVVATDHQKYSYSEMKADIKLLAKRYPDQVSYNVIGQSEDGRDIYDVVLGNPEAKKSLLVVAAIHAREYMTSLLCMNQIEYYLRYYSKKIDGEKVEDTLDKVAIHFVPMVNPDGVTLSQFGIKKIKSASLRAKLRKISGGDTKHWKANARGANLNDNFPFRFKKKGKPSGAAYTGPRASSESETQALVRLVKKLKKKSNLKGIVNYHAMGSIVFGDCSGSKLCKRVTAKMFKVAKQTTGYISAAGVYNSVSSGSFRDYVMYKLDIPSITIEIGKIQCPGPISEFPSIWKKNKSLVLREARLLA